MRHFASNRNHGSHRFFRALLLSVTGACILWCIVVWVAEPRLIFLGAGTGNVGSHPVDAEIYRVVHPDGATTDLWIRSPEGPGPHPLVLVLHGSTDRIDLIAEDTMRWLHDLGYVAALAEYRGYGNSTGTPSASAIAEDLVRIVDILLSRGDVDPSRIVYFGTSLGACLAAHLTAEREPHALILRTPFLRTDVVAHRFFAPPFLLRNVFRPDLALSGFSGPALVLKHRYDDVAPPDHADALAALMTRAELVTIDAGHTTAGHPQERNREGWVMTEFLRRVSAGRDASALLR